MSKESKKPTTSDVKGLKDKAKIQKNSEVFTSILNCLDKKYIESKFKSFDGKPPEELLLIGTIKHVLDISKGLGLELAKYNGLPYMFNGNYWESVSKDSLTYFLGKAAKKIGVSYFYSGYYEFRNKLYKQFLSEAHKESSLPDKDLVKINLKNGTFVIKPNGTSLEPFNPDDFLTYQLPFRYDPNATAPIFVKFLDRVLPDKNLQKILAEYLGSLFIKNGSTIFKEEKALVLFGTGANGKSVVFEVVSALLGIKNVTSYTLNSLTNEKGYYRAKIGDKLVNYSSEINNKLEASMFKQLVSGEPVEARLPYGEPFILTQYAKLIFNTNELPKSVEHTNAFFRRFIIINFDVTIPKNEQDKRLHLKIIESELAGVFNWVLAGLERLLQQKRFSESESINKAVDIYRKQSDNVNLFLEEKNYIKSVSNYEFIKDLYLNYKAYCNENRFKILNKTNFKNRLNGLDIITKRKNLGNVAYLEKRKNTEEKVPF